MKEIARIWFTNAAGCIGIIIGEDVVTGERKAYIGIGKGDNENDDAKTIKNWGNKLSLTRVKGLVTMLSKKEN